MSIGACWQSDFYDNAETLVSQCEWRTSGNSNLKLGRKIKQNGFSPKITNPAFRINKKEMAKNYNYSTDNFNRIIQSAFKIKIKHFEYTENNTLETHILRIIHFEHLF